MLKWIPYVMVRVVAFFIIGILVGIYFPDFIPQEYASLLFAILLLSYSGLYAFIKFKSWGSLVSGIIGLSAIFLSGYLSLLNKSDFRSPRHYSHFEKPIEFYEARVTNAPELKPNSYKTEVEITEIRSGNLWRPVTGRCLVYISKQSPVDLRYGDEIIVKGPPMKLSSPSNPGEFDFRYFLSLKNISHQQFVKLDQIRIIHHIADKGALFYSQQARVWAAGKIRKFVHGDREQAITMALVLGIVEGLDNELQDAYAASGAMHVLSVSGLHVGIIYAIILLLLKPISSVSWSRWLTAFLSLICLWSYAFMTGLSPSVLRAVMMFSFIVIAKPFGRNTNIYNTLAASAFLLLLVDPYLILSVGFQLSYLAVIGIVYLQRPLYQMWEPASLFWDKLWQMTCVSIVAQLATFALGLYYFHQFPVYSLLSNLLVIPLSTAVLITGIVLLAVSPVSWMANAAGFALQFLVKLLNGSVFLVEGMPFSVIRGVQITACQCWLIMGAVVSLILLFRTRKFEFLISAGFIVAMFCALEWLNFRSNMSIDELVVYAIPGHSAVERIKSGNSYFYTDSTLLNDKQLVRFHILPNRLLSGVGTVHTNRVEKCLLRSYQGYRIFLWKRKRILWIDKRNYDLPDNIETDYLIIGRNAVKSLQVILPKVKFRQLILDGSNSRIYVMRMLNEASEKKISVYSVMDQGAFIVNL